MKKSLISLAVGAVVGLAAMSSVFATPIVLNNGVDFGPNGSTKTDPTKNLGYTGTLATSIYLGNPATAGTVVIDTNNAATMNAYGFSLGNKTALDGLTTITPSYPANPDALNINALNGPPVVSDKNGFVDGETLAYGTSFFNALAGGIGNGWGLTYKYTIQGVSTGTVVNFNAGQFDLFYEDGGVTSNNGKQVLRLNLTGSQFNLNNLTLSGFASFDFDSNGSDDAVGDTFIQNLFNDSKPGGQSFYTNWLANSSALQWALNTNVNPPLPTLDQIFAGNVDLDPNTSGVQGALFRQSELNGTINFNVPEPGSLALLGLGLAGLGLLQRRRNLVK